MHRRGFPLCALATLLCLIGTAPLASAAPARTFQLAISSQPLAAALQELARQSGIQIIFFSKFADGHEAPAVRGTVTIDDALHRMLGGTHLTYRRLNTNVIEIRPPSVPVAGALAHQSDPPQMFAAAFTPGGSRSDPPSDPAADPPAAASEPMLAVAQHRSPLHTVIVTGTRSVGMTEATSMSPIDVITPASLAATGTSNLASALSVLLPSFNFPQSSLTGIGADVVMPAEHSPAQAQYFLVVEEIAVLERQKATRIHGHRGGIARLVLRERTEEPARPDIAVIDHREAVQVHLG